MLFDDYHLNNDVGNSMHSKNFLVTVRSKTGVTLGLTEFIRFEEKRGQFVWVHPSEICFVKSADHYVKTLIKCRKKLIWMNRHSTLKELLDILPGENFIRLNRFYVLNLNYFSHINERERFLYFQNGLSIPIPHRISPFLCHSLKTTCT